MAFTSYCSDNRSDDASQASKEYPKAISSNKSLMPGCSPMFCGFVQMMVRIKRSRVWTTQSLDEDRLHSIVLAMVPDLTVVKGGLLVCGLVGWRFPFNQAPRWSKHLRTGRVVAPSPEVFGSLALGLQIPSKKVLNLLKTPQSTFWEGTWSPRVGYYLKTWCICRHHGALLCPSKTGRSKTTSEQEALMVMYLSRA